MSNEATVLLNNVKEIIEIKQFEKAYFKTQKDKLEIVKKQLIVINRNLTNKVIFDKEKSHCKFKHFDLAYLIVLN